MTMKLKASNESLEIVYNEGEHIVQVQSVEAKTSRTSGAEYYTLTLKGDDLTNGNVQTFYWNIFDNPYGRKDLYKLYVALGIDPERDDIEEEELTEGVFGIVLTEGQPYNDKRQWNVSNVFELEADEDSEEVFGHSEAMDIADDDLPF